MVIKMIRKSILYISLFELLYILILTIGKLLWSQKPSMKFKNMDIQFFWRDKDFYF
ncbi:unnamed protein product [Paramecium pentaurelia]|uniref:Uncharacterized protein n=1 Tax=Paramecium pentaurelia TaxID=43138 RepID=A0A8S1YFI9_9CILI|nr:unnamed protein product [Paramecium pentaurelia]